MKILVIDDNPDLCELVKTMLEQVSYSTISAKNGTEALEKAELEKPDLILMDVMMPGMDGWETTRLLRAKPHSKNVPILAMSALSRKSDIDACFKAGCTDVILKPFTFLNLRERIQEILADTAARQKISAA